MIMSDEKMGIEESKEALAALNVLAVDLIQLMKKHAGVAEVISALLADEALKESLMKAYEGVSKVPSELKDLDMAEMMDLALVELSALPKILSALKG
jgi:hypothetical protein